MTTMTMHLIYRDIDAVQYLLDSGKLVESLREFAAKCPEKCPPHTTVLVVPTETGSQVTITTGKPKADLPEGWEVMTETCNIGEMGKA